MTEQERTRCEAFWNARIARLNYNFLQEYHAIANERYFTGADIHYLTEHYRNIEWARQRRNDLTKNHGEW